MVDQAVNVLPQIKSGEHQGAGRVDDQAFAAAARRADHRRGRPQGLRGHDLERLLRAQGTSKDVVAKLNQALVVGALSDDKVKVRLTELAVDLPEGKEATPEALGAQLKASIDKWVPAVRAAGVKPE